MESTDKVRRGDTNPMDERIDKSHLKHFFSAKEFETIEEVDNYLLHLSEEFTKIQVVAFNSNDYTEHRASFDLQCSSHYLIVEVWD
jgi:hypothetical protein